MKFICHWQVHPDKRGEVLAGFAEMELSEYQSLGAPEVKVIGRWHDLANTTGVAICETDSVEALQSFCMLWHEVCDFELVPCLDDAEAHAVARKVNDTD